MLLCLHCLDFASVHGVCHAKGAHGERLVEGDFMKVHLVDVLMYGPKARGAGPEVLVTYDKRLRVWCASFDGLNKAQRAMLAEATSDKVELLGNDRVSLGTSDIGSAIARLLRDYSVLVGKQPIYRFQRYDRKKVCVRDEGTHHVVLDATHPNRLTRGRYGARWLLRLMASEECAMATRPASGGMQVQLATSPTDPGERIAIFRTLLGLYAPPRNK